MTAARDAPTTDNNNMHTATKAIVFSSSFSFSFLSYFLSSSSLLRMEQTPQKHTQQVDDAQRELSKINRSVRNDSGNKLEIERERGGRCVLS